MLACLRLTSRRLLPSAAFSTSAPAPKVLPQNDRQLAELLQDEARLSNPLPHVIKTVFPVYEVLAPGQTLLPNSLTYKASLIQQRPYKRAAVAPAPAVARQRDTFHQLKLDPRHFTANAPVLSHFVTEMGKIKGRDQTGLTSKSQRLLGRTIRRAKMMGIIPTLSKGYRKFH